MSGCCLPPVDVLAGAKNISVSDSIGGFPKGLSVNQIYAYALY